METQSHHEAQIELPFIVFLEQHTKDNTKQEGRGTKQVNHQNIRRVKLSAHYESKWKQQLYTQQLPFYDFITSKRRPSKIQLAWWQHKT